MFYRPYNCQMRAKKRSLKDKALIAKGIKKKQGSTK